MLRGGGESPSGRCKPPKRKMQTTSRGRCKPPKRKIPRFQDYQISISYTKSIQDYPRLTKTPISLPNFHSKIFQDLIRFQDIDPIFKIYQISIPFFCKIYEDSKILIPYPKFQNFEVSKFQKSFRHFRRYRSHIPKFHLCFLEYIDPIFKIFKNLLDGPSGFFGSRLFQHFQTLRFSTF